MTGHTSTIAILGTGWMARALGAAVARSAITVVFASRAPHKDKGFELAGEVLSVEECLSRSPDLVILAVPASAHAFVAEQYGHLLDGKVVVDISNTARKAPLNQPSQAELLQELLPGASVVKAFNSVSAYGLTNQVNCGAAKVVKVCGNSPSAVSKVKELIQDMGMTPVSVGSLQAARALERGQHDLFPGWVVPGLVASVLFVFNLIYSLIWYVYLDVSEPPYEPVMKVSQLPATVMNTIVANTAVLCLCATYLPGSVASLAQLLRRDAVSAFPTWLRGWLNARKELGLLTFWFALVHAILISIQLTSDKWFSLYDIDLQTYRALQLNVYGQVVILSGVLAFSWMLILAVNSIPSVGSTLSYKEWRLVFTWMGYLVLATVFLHEFLYTASYSTCNLCKAFAGGKTPKVGAGWPINSTGGKVPPPTVITTGVTALTLLLKIVLTLPPLGWMLDRLKQGGRPRGTAVKLPGATDVDSPQAGTPQVLARTYNTQSSWGSSV